MAKKIIYSVPIFLVIVSIITSLIAFDYNKNLENAFIYINNNESDVKFDGEYYSVFGNLGDNSVFISVESLTDYLLITIYNSNEAIVKEYTLIVKEKDNSYSSSIITETIGSNPLTINDIEEYFFKLNLEKDKTYETILTKTTNNIEDEEIDLVLINIPEHLLNMKNLNEGISFTTMVFAVLSGATILVMIYIKKTE